MNYTLVNKDGEELAIDYVCFGALAMFGTMSSREWCKYPGHPNEPLKEEVVQNERLGEVSYIKGFKPSDVVELHYYPNTSLSYNVDHDWDLIENMVSKYEIFEGIEVNKKEGYISSKMGNKKMDSTMLPMFILRNFWECASSRNAMGIMKDVFPDSEEELFFLCQFYHPWKRYSGQLEYSATYLDGAPLSPSEALVGDVIQFALGKAPDAYFDYTWEESDLGYASYGMTPSYDNEPGPDATDEEWDFYYDEGGIEGIELPDHPRTMKPTALSTCLVRHDVSEWDDFWKSSPIGHNRVSCETLIGKIITQVKEIKNAT